VAGQYHRPRALSDPSPEGLCYVVGIGDKRPIVINGVDVNADLVTEVQRVSLVKPLRQTLLAWCKTAGIVAPMYTWEQRQSHCKLHKLLFLAAARGAGGLGGRRRRWTRFFLVPAAWMIGVLPTWCAGGVIHLWLPSSWRTWDGQWRTPQWCSRVMAREGGGTTLGGEGGGIEGRIIVLFI
jgi:hypothetical protein